MTASHPHPKFRRPRLRAVLKWSGLTLSVLIFALWLPSGWWGFSLTRLAGTDSSSVPAYNRDKAWKIGIYSGSLSVLVARDAKYGAQPEWFWSWSWDEPRSLVHVTGGHGPAWYWRFRRFTTTNSLFWTIPLWLPFLLIGLPTGFLFFRDHKVRPGLCAVCRYDLRGLPVTTSKCPECGSVRTFQASERSG